jgi:hypothetical protein
MENMDIKEEPIDDELSIIEVKEEKNVEIDQSNDTEIASKNSEENSFELRKETKDYSKVEKKGGKAQKTEIICEICNKRQSSKFNLRQHIASVHEKKDLSCVPFAIEASQKRVL